MHSKRSTCLLFAACVALAACSAGPTDEPLGKQQARLLQQGSTFANHLVQVCWITPGWATEKAKIQAYVHDSWEKAANLQFTWEECAGVGAAPRVRIVIVEGSSSGGSANIGAANRLATDNDHSNMTLWLGVDPPTDDRGLRYLAVHEFGHILGFAHEQDQPGPGAEACRQSLCRRATGQSSGAAFDACVANVDMSGIPLGNSYDRDSVMSYCGPEDGSLSPGDIDGVREVYGFPRNCERRACVPHTCGLYDDSCGMQECCTRGCPGRLCLPGDSLPWPPVPSPPRNDPTPPDPLADAGV
jgi:hypothetical protein